MDTSVILAQPRGSRLRRLPDRSGHTSVDSDAQTTPKSPKSSICIVETSARKRRFCPYAKTGFGRPNRPLVPGFLHIKNIFKRDALKSDALVPMTLGHRIKDLHKPKNAHKCENTLPKRTPANGYPKGSRFWCPCIKHNGAIMLDTRAQFW